MVNDSAQSSLKVYSKFILIFGSVFIHTMSHQIVIARTAQREQYTIGHMYIDGQYFCDTLEPTDSGLTFKHSLDRIAAAKQKTLIAIPRGIYRTSNKRYSPSLKMICPYLQNVPGFEGILIHAGNTIKDTKGCILVGKNSEVGKVTNSRSTLYSLLQLLSDEDSSDIIIV